MTNFDIIGALRTACIAAGIKFIWRHDEFYANIAADMQYTEGQRVLVIDLKPTPVINGNKIGDITYSGLFMLGQKMDSVLLGTSASLDETALQKYDARLLSLTTDIVTFATTFACANTLELKVGQIDYIFNLYDSNIDFVACQNISFVQ